MSAVTAIGYDLNRTSMSNSNRIYLGPVFMQSLREYDCPHSFADPS